MFAIRFVCEKLNSIPRMNRDNFKWLDAGWMGVCSSLCFKLRQKKVSSSILFRFHRMAHFKCKCLFEVFHQRTAKKVRFYHVNENSSKYTMKTRAYFRIWFEFYDNVVSFHENPWKSLSSVKVFQLIRCRLAYRENEFSI